MWHNLQSNPIALQTNKQNPKPIFVQRKPNVKNYSSTPPWHILAPTGIYFAGIPWLKTHSWFVEITSRLLKTATGENARIYSGKVNKKDQIKFSADNKFRRVRFPGLIRMKAIMFRLNLNLVRIKGSTWTIILFYSNCAASTEIRFGIRSRCRLDFIKMLLASTAGLFIVCVSGCGNVC